MSLKENIQNNKMKALYYLGIIIAACLKGMIEIIQSYLPENTLWGDLLMVFSGYAIVAVSLIAPLIFGNDGAIERVKTERTENGVEVARLASENEGYRITNKIQADLLGESGHKTYRYEGFKEEKKEEEVEEEKKKIEELP